MNLLTLSELSIFEISLIVFTVFVASIIRGFNGFLVELAKKKKIVNGGAGTNQR